MPERPHVAAQGAASRLPKSGRPLAGPSRTPMRRPPESSTPTSAPLASPHSESVRSKSLRMSLLAARRAISWHRQVSITLPNRINLW